MYAERRKKSKRSLANPKNPDKGDFLALGTRERQEQEEYFGEGREQEPNEDEHPKDKE